MEQRKKKCWRTASGPFINRRTQQLPFFLCGHKLRVCWRASGRPQCAERVWMCVPACGCIPVSAEELWHRNGALRSPRRHPVLSCCRATEGSGEGSAERWEEESERRRTAARASNKHRQTLNKCSKTSAGKPSAERLCMLSSFFLEKGSVR